MPSPIQSESPPSIILPNFTLNQKEINLRNVEFITPRQGWNNSACGGHSTTTTQKKKTDSFLPHLRKSNIENQIYVFNSRTTIETTHVILWCRTWFSETADRCLRLLSAKSNLFKSSNFKIAPSLLAKGLLFPLLVNLRNPCEFCAHPLCIGRISRITRFHTQFLGDWLGKWKACHQLATCLVDLLSNKKVEKLSRKFRIHAELATLQILTAGLSACLSQILIKG